MREISVTRDFRHVLRYCQAWGVPVNIIRHKDGAVIPPPDRKGAYVAPTTFGYILWPERHIIWSEDECDLPNELLHELAHCLQRKNPNRADEVNGPMLAFEFFSNRYLHIAGRTQWMQNFAIGDHNSRGKPLYNLDWQGASTQLRGKLIRRSLARCVRASLLTHQGKPTFQRPKFSTQRKETP